MTVPHSTSPVLQNQTSMAASVSDQGSDQIPEQAPVQGLDQRLVIQDLSDSSAALAAAAAQLVVEGLTRSPKAVPPQFFYDDRGSALFEQITDLPEYYLTRTERAILQGAADAIATQTGPCELVELGSGSATKTRILMDAYQQQQIGLRYLPVDVSGGILKDSALALLDTYPTLTVHGLVGTYAAALDHLPPRHLPTRMIAFIGSTLGNLNPTECQALLNRITTALSPGDYFLLGIDLRKPVDRLTAAYNDSQGVTAAFNLNMLHHLNWRFQGDFQPDQFQHVAFYDPDQHRVEMHLESLQAQTVTLGALDLQIHFAPGERLLSEISRKFDLSEITATLAQYNLHPVHNFTDPQQWFGLVLAQKTSAS